jgi:hypothetical protein
MPLVPAGQLPTGPHGLNAAANAVIGVGSLVGSFDTQSHRSPRRCGAEMPQLVHTPIERPPSQRCRMTACGRKRPFDGSYFHGLNDRASPRQFLGGPTIFHFRVARSDLVALGDVRVSTIGPIVSWTGPLGICFDRGWTASRPHIVLPRQLSRAATQSPMGVSAADPLQRRGASSACPCFLYACQALPPRGGSLRKLATGATRRNVSRARAQTALCRSWLQLCGVRDPQTGKRPAHPMRAMPRTEQSRYRLRECG